MFYLIYFGVVLLVFFSLIYFQYLTGQNTLIKFILVKIFGHSNSLISLLSYCYHTWFKHAKNNTWVLYQNNRSKYYTTPFYSPSGSEYTLYIPYRERDIHRYLSIRIFLMRDGNKIQLNHPPGLPFSCSANDLDGDTIIISDIDSGEERKYTGNQIPSIY